MPRRALPRLEQEVGIGLLCAKQRLAGRARVDHDVGSATRLVRRLRILQGVRQLANPTTHVLLSSNEILRRVGRGRDATAREQLQHLARSQPLARLERRSHPAAVPLDERELRIHLPFVGEKRGSPLRQDERAAGTLELGERAAQLARGRVGRAPPLAAKYGCPTRMQLPCDFRRDAVAEPLECRAIERIRRNGRARASIERCPLAQRGRGRRAPPLAAKYGCPTRMQLPCDFRRDAVAEPLECRAIERIRRNGRARASIERCPLAQRGRGRNGITSSFKFGRRACHMTPSRGSVAARQDRAPERDAGQRGGSRIARCQLRAQRRFEQRLSVDRIVSREQQQGAPLLRLGLARGFAPQTIERLGARV
ncbi:MAG: hypothetical protein AUJ01_06970 [Acidobacteria bacterium 13_1_40CM_3_65_5]|nr:MAG: hypothetical protein AUJ01_06970 [Acidobacteria bacterium 13_1_40CM_3_65_5]